MQQLARSRSRSATTCQHRQGRRGSGGSGKGDAARQQQRGSGASRPGGSAVSQLSEAAKAAAKRAGQFSQQRFERAVRLGSGQPPDSSGSRAGRGAGDAGSGDDDAEPQQQLLRRYVDVVCEQLRSSSSSGNGAAAGGRGRGAKRSAARSLLEAHSAVFQAALDIELQEEWQQAEERLASWPPARLSAEGVALFHLAAAPDGGLFRDVAVKFFVPNRPLPFHALSQGDILLISRGDPLGDALTGVLVGASSRWLRLALSPAAAAAIAAAGHGAAWRLDLFANTSAHERCSEALRRFAEPAGAGGQQQQQQLEQRGGSVGAAVAAQQELLWRVLSGVLPPGAALPELAATPPPWVRSPQGRQRLAAAKAGIREHVSAGRLNASQGDAIAAALSRTVTLWQGPPGTGKTTTLLRCCQAATGLLGGGGQLLAVAASNVAVDNIVGGLLELGVSVTRVGQPAKLAPAVQQASLEAMAAATPAGQEAARLRRQLVAAAASARGSSSSKGGGGGGKGGSKRSGGGGSSSSQQGGGGAWEQMLALEAAAAAEVLGRVQVVAATCVGAGDPVLAGREFSLVVLDEATQAPEPAALVALAGRANSLIMVGDPRQLPPTVKSPEAERLGLTVSLFERLQAMGLGPLLLNVQYRMHPALCEWPGSAFYGGKLTSWPKPGDRPLPRGLCWPNPQVPVVFVQCDGPERRARASVGVSRAREARASTDSDDDAAGADDDSSSSSSSSSSGGGGGAGRSYLNPAEAGVVTAVLQQLLASGLDAGDVCVISPYSGQVREVQQRLQGGGSGGGSSSSSSSSSSLRLSPKQLELLEVRSVDGFQGREKEAVVFSAVRSNAASRVGFLADARRLNVALTRARRGLVVVGDARTLRGDPTWRAWLGWAARQGVVVGARALLGGAAAAGGGGDEGAGVAAAAVAAAAPSARSHPA